MLYKKHKKWRNKEIEWVPEQTLHFFHSSGGHVYRLGYVLRTQLYEVEFVLFLTEEAWSHGGLRSREAKPLLMLPWVTNVSTTPDLYIEFSTEY